MKNIERKTWDEFRDVKLLWWVNRSLHLFGWSIVVELNRDGKISNAYPAKVKFRGFCEKIESDGFKGLSTHLKRNISRLTKESKL